MIPTGVKKYTLVSIEGTPAVLSAILGGYSSSDPIWDKRPEPERFTLREVVAHVADWDEIFLQRMKRTAAEDYPTLPNLDEGELAVERNYAAQDPHANLDRLAKNRAALVSFLRGLEIAAFERAALRPELGPMTIEHQMLLILAHDGYHTRQAAEYAAAA